MVGYSLGACASIVPMSMPFQASHCCSSQGSQLGTSKDYFSPLILYIDPPPDFIKAFIAYTSYPLGWKYPGLYQLYNFTNYNSISTQICNDFISKFYHQVLEGIQQHWEQPIMFGTHWPTSLKLIPIIKLFDSLWCLVVVLLLHYRIYNI